MQTTKYILLNRTERDAWVTETVTKGLTYSIEFKKLGDENKMSVLIDSEGRKFYCLWSEVETEDAHYASLRLKGKAITNFLKNIGVDEYYLFIRKPYLSETEELKCSYTELSRNFTVEQIVEVLETEPLFQLTEEDMFVENTLNVIASRIKPYTIKDSLKEAYDNTFSDENIAKLRADVEETEILINFPIR